MHGQWSTVSCFAAARHHTPRRERAAARHSGFLRGSAGLRVGLQVQFRPMQAQIIAVTPRNHGGFWRFRRFVANRRPCRACGRTWWRLAMPAWCCAKRHSPALGLGSAQLAPRGRSRGTMAPARRSRRSADAGRAGSRNVVTHDRAVKFTKRVGSPGSPLDICPAKAPRVLIKPYARLRARAPTHACSSYNLPIDEIFIEK